MNNNKPTPLPILRTARLTLRELAGRDEEGIFALRSDDRVNKYLDRKACSNLDKARDFIRMILQNRSFYWAVTYAETRELIGTVCLYGFPPDKSEAGIGYELLPDFQGKGLMQEAVSAVIEFGLKQTGLRTITACTHTENQPSVRLLEKLGFTQNSVDGEMTVFKLEAPCFYRSPVAPRPEMPDPLRQKNP